MTIQGGKQVNNYPLQMRHPNSRAAVAKAVQFTDPVSGRKGIDYQGGPDVFPPITVNSYDQEIRERRNGYLAVGETPEAFEYASFPKWLHHPDYVAPIEAVHPIIDRQSNVVIPGKPAIPAVLPDVLVQDDDEQAKWEAKGYREAGIADALAAQSLAAHVDRDYVPRPDGWDDPGIEKTSSGHAAYPMWVGDKLVNSRAEHDRLVGSAAMPDAIEVARQKREAAKLALAKAQAELDAADAMLGSAIVEGATETEPEDEAPATDRAAEIRQKRIDALAKARAAKKSAQPAA